MLGAIAVAGPRRTSLSLRSPDPRWSEALPLPLFDAGDDALDGPHEIAVAEDESAQGSHAISRANGQDFQLVAAHVPSPPPLTPLRSTRTVHNGRNYAGAPNLELGRGPARCRHFASSRRNGACGTPALPSWPEDSNCRTSSRQS